MESKLLRIIDANFNRTKEALRVCEDISRFYMDEPALTRKLKSCRHKVTRILKSSPVEYKDLVSSRNAKQDVGKDSDYKNKSNLNGIFLANMQRCKESLRVLEESHKILNGRLSEQFKNVRFGVYSIEKDAVKKMSKKNDSIRKS